MKRFFLTLCLIFLTSNVVFGFEEDYRQIYMDLQVPNFSYVHGIDPAQYYDNQSSTWSPYPLFRLSSALYFKTITIVPGYYLLTPVSHKGADYLLFKECGVVKYTVPVYKKEFVPEGFYDSHIAKPRLGRIKTCQQNFMIWVGKNFKSAQRKPTPQSYMEINDLDNKFVEITVYYGPYRYYTLFRTVAM